MKKVGEIKVSGHGRLCIYKDDAVNSYKVINRWKDLGEYGIVERQRTIATFTDLKSCVALILEMV